MDRITVIYVKFLLRLKKIGQLLSLSAMNKNEYLSFWLYRRYNFIGKKAWSIINSLPCQACGNTGGQERVLSRHDGFFCNVCMVFPNGYGQHPKAKEEG